MNRQGTAHVAPATALAVLVFFFTGACALAAPQGEPSATTPPTSIDAWPYSRGDLLNTGKSLSGADARLGKVKWRFLAGAAITITPVSRDGVIYFGDQSANFFAVDIKTGKRLWQSVPRSLARKPKQAYTYSSPAVDDERVYVATQEGSLTAFSRSDGSIVWEREYTHEIYSSMRLAAGRLLFGCKDCRFHAVDAKTGDALWSYECGDIVGSSAAVLVSSKRVIFPSHDKFLHVVNLETGEPIVKWDIGFRSTGQPAVAFGCLYMCATGRNFMCIDLFDGSVRWTQEALPDNQHGVGVGKDRVFVHLSKNLSCFDAVTGKPLWKASLTGAGAVSPCVGPEFVYISDVKGSVYAIDPVDGTIKWNITVGEGSHSSPILVDGILYVADGQGYLNAIE